MALRSLILTALLVGLMAAIASADPPVGDFSVDPNPPNQHQPATFSFEPDPGSEGATVEWDFDGDSILDDTGDEVQHTFSAPGSVTVRMTMTDGGESDFVEKTFLVNAAPVVGFDFAPDSPLPGDPVLFSVTANTEPGASLKWDFGDGSAKTSESVPRHAYAAPGTYTVELTATDAGGAEGTKTRQITVRSPTTPVNAPPLAGFVWSPSKPIVGQAADFISISSDPEGPLAAQAWDLDGDGEFDDASGASVSHAFAAAGTYDVGLQVTDSGGTVRTVRRTVTVSAATVQPSDNEPGFITPFPVVRLAGKVLPRGALVRLLVVRAPRGALVRVSCKGEGCPVRRVRRTSKGGSLRFAQVERRLRVGIRLEIFVRQPQMIGKYTRFLVRAGAPPTRTDRCLFPGDQRPRACP